MVDVVVVVDDQGTAKRKLEVVPQKLGGLPALYLLLLLA